MDEQEFSIHQNHAYFAGEFVEVYVMQIEYRAATIADVSSLARLRSEGWGEAEYWIPRITGYMREEHHPQKALIPRVVYVAVENNKIIGFIAGHLTQRLECEGELEWIDVTSAYRRKGIATQLACILAAWFVEQKASKVCVDPGNDNARKFYAALGAGNLNAHWMYWEDISVLLKDKKST
jgi:ribosomal protein S18 acetylase RimI-like enzyme